MSICPVCLEQPLETDDPNNANWVALGEAVCSQECHTAAYDLEKYMPYDSIIHDVGEP